MKIPPDYTGNTTNELIRYIKKNYRTLVEDHGLMDKYIRFLLMKCITKSKTLIGGDKRVFYYIDWHNYYNMPRLIQRHLGKNQYHYTDFSTRLSRIHCIQAYYTLKLPLMGGLSTIAKRNFIEYMNKLTKTPIKRILKSGVGL